MEPYGVKAHIASITAHSATSLTVNAGAKGGTIVYDLTGDGTAEIPVTVILP
jgi:hypothetical protein